MRLGSLLVPVDDRLVGDAVFVIQGLLKFLNKKDLSVREKNPYLYNLRERFHNPRILITIHLHSIYERHFRLRVATEWFKNFREFL